MNVDLELYRVFYTVAKHKHMTKASEELHISQPAISQSIKKLEDQLGGTLFLRSNKGMKLTSFSETKLSGSVTAKNNCTLYTSINYDDSWDVYIDGVKANDEQIVSIGGALLGIRLESGTHNIEFKYHAQGLSLGLLISFVSLVILIATIFIPKFYKKEEEALV